MYATVTYIVTICRGGGVGRHARLKILWPQGRAGSNPALGTKKEPAREVQDSYFSLWLIFDT